ncbi:MAG: hypothetical protein O3B32_05140, partial [Cyanobacteria bacterium]|nr:hypothetical protein [Cyanobacteriota bacterium]
MASCCIRQKFDSKRRHPAAEQGFLLPLSSAAALLLLVGSLSLQTVSLEARRHLQLQLQLRQQQDLLSS